MKEKLTDLFEYTHHFNSEMITTISKNLPKVYEKTMSLMNHILNAHQIWNSRVLHETAFEVWQMNSFEDLNTINHQNFQKSIKILNDFDLDQVIRYKNSKGKKFENTVFEMLFQAINHATYHRGQMNS